jgi:hypothetical protein
MAADNIQINIKENGTVTLATVGKYCDRNIDVNINVPAKASQFTNLYAPENVMPKKAVNGSSSGITYQDDNYCNVIVIPYHHAENEPVAMRIRGIGTVRDRMGCGTLAADGVTRVNHYQISSTSYFDLSYDEHGDAVITFKGNVVSTEWYYFVFTFQYIGINSGVAEALAGPIVTINESIGNGGHAE